MKRPALTNTLLFVIAVALAAIAVRQYLQPQTAAAQVEQPYPFWIEPGTQMLRAPDASKQVYGRVIVDMRDGKVWGFPTVGTDTYPTNQLDPKPPVSHPFLLGRFAFEETQSKE